MEKVYAVIRNGIVINTIILSEDSEWIKEPGDIIVEITGHAGIGWGYDGKTFTPPVVVKTPEQIAAENLLNAQNEYTAASSKIQALRDQIEDEDWGNSSESEVRSELSAWTEYRKALRSYLNTGDGSNPPPKM
ncbi:hypothetical protein V6E05_01030 [Citrobacter freundii]|uniref:hypothetical protein n=1 Tax=Citrobacter freundii TaxID=546 RepID=UPI002FDB0A7B